MGKEGVWGKLFAGERMGSGGNFLMGKEGVWGKLLDVCNYMKR